MTKNLPHPPGGWIACALVLLVIPRGLLSAEQAVPLVENGAPRSVIVLPDRATNNDRAAATDLQDHLRRASGCAAILVTLPLGTVWAVPPTTVAWEQTGAIPAPELHQAAAADDRFVYAIANKVVAKYDRESGARLAVSSGEARHLNSGFFWKGRLYCAHSNYPEEPELSDIKVLDPETMELTTYKDFGEYGGSLTWAVRHQESWWCMFAKYGADNAASFLVRFDDQWRERGRWTFPPAMIPSLGRHSVSGGIWRGDRLLVTDHDNPILYVLRVPREGSTLELVETQNAPFSGQGIAHDPTTGGLVGIQRSRKLLIFAERRDDPEEDR